MKKKNAPVIFLVIVVVAVVFLASKYGASAAAAIYPDLFRLTANNQPRLKVNTSTTIPDQPNPTSVNQNEMSQASSEEKNASLTGGELVKEMVQRWKDRELIGPGWVHFVYKTTSAVENGVVLPDGSMMPRTYVKDGWFFLNDQGLVEKDVVTLKDEFGNVFQQAAFVDGMHINITLGEKFEGERSYELKSDLGLSQELSNMETQGVKIAIRDIDYKGKLSTEFSAAGTYENPVVLSNSPMPVESITLVASFDNQTGAMNQSKKIWKLTDGTEVVFEDNEIESLERADAPAEIVAILESVK
jgi:hypothetical protein